MYNRDPNKNTRVAEIFSFGKLSEQVKVVQSSYLGTYTLSAKRRYHRKGMCRVGRIH